MNRREPHFYKGKRGWVIRGADLVMGQTLYVQRQDGRRVKVILGSVFFKSAEGICLAAILSSEEQHA